MISWIPLYSFFANITAGADDGIEQIMAMRLEVGAGWWLDAEMGKSVRTQTCYYSVYTFTLGTGCI